MMGFEAWFNQQELYGLKSERFYDLMDRLTDDSKLKKSLVAWLEAAYESGYEEGAGKTVQNNFEKECE